jgi:carboxypeptidase C (cathepsin A)
MFFVAYTKDGDDVKTRPVSFLYNGGPGSATVWLHMGSFAPRMVRMADEGFQPPPPYQLVDNVNSLLDTSDLVFIDAIDTGYSRGVAGINTAQFHGQAGDIRSFGDFINNYLTTYSRWPSPRYPTSGDVRPWTYDQNRYTDMTEALRGAMTRNPYLRILVACGYYDSATPLGGAEFNFSHLAYDAAVTSRVAFTYYEAGHMIYTRSSAHKQLKLDVAKFLRTTNGSPTN